MLAQRSIKDTYSSVGGLNKQIEEIRDLLEIPLTRPELFRYFGEWSMLRKNIIIYSVEKGLSRQEVFFFTARPEQEKPTWLAP